MPSRLSGISVLAVAVPAVVVLLAVLVLARPPAAAPADTARQSTAPTGTGGVPSNTPAARATASTSQAADAKPTPIPSGPIAPEISGGAWINSEPLKLADLRGKVVLVDFWTYGCYNCTNTLPYLKQWWDKYKDQGLVIIGVHTPEFESEKLLENVQRAVQSDAIGWPVVQDNDKHIWQAYGNRYWPRFYLIDYRGQIIYDHIGEGAYDETERQIVTALAAAKKT